MRPNDFVKAYLPYALETEAATGISAAAILAQAALESGWGEKAPGNMFFGVKDPDKGKTGKGQLIVTTEYLKNPNAHHLFPEVISVVWSDKFNKWKYTVRDWFRKFDTPAGSFLEHAHLFLKNPRYAQAVANGKDPERFFREVQKAGYATAPNYADVLIAVARTVQRNMPSEFESANTGDADFPMLPGEEEMWMYMPHSESE
ncbi:MAG: glucosaminidase domain-containing protein [Saprospiraceae bacterium]|nr:glucosaminidase domain-containing protein [Saprospiraceae bacterium]